MSFPQYPSYKDSGVPWLGQVPAHWDIAPLKVFCSCNDDVLSEKTASDFELLYVDISNVDRFNGITSKEQFKFSFAPSRARRKVTNGDIIISTVRTYLRAIAQIKNPEHNLVVSTGFAVVRPTDSVHSVYLGYFASSHYFVDQVVALSTGVNYPSITATQLMNIAALIPSIEEQAQIAAFLDRETAKIDALVAEQQRLLTLLKEKRQALISHAVTKGLNPNAPMKPSGIDWLGDIPAHWEITRLGNLLHQVNDQGDDKLPILSVSIHYGITDKETEGSNQERKISRSEDKSKYKQVIPGDLVYNMMRAWQGGLGTASTNGLVSPAYVVSRQKTNCDTTFIEYLLRTPNAIEQMRRHSKGVTDFRLRLYWDEFKNIQIAVPPMDESRRICNDLDRISRDLKEVEKTSIQMVELLQERRAALISAAVTGKIDVRQQVPEVVG